MGALHAHLVALRAQVAHEPEFGEGIFAEQGRDPLKYTRYIVLEYESPDASDADELDVGMGTERNVWSDPIGVLPTSPRIG